MKVLGKDCRLTVSKQDIYTTLPVTQETIRISSKGFSLPASIGKINREINISLQKQIILGCFVTRLEYNNIYFLFSLLASFREYFDIYINHVISKVIYKNLTIKGFQLRAENENPFYLHVDINSNRESYTNDWNNNIPILNWQPVPTYFFNGHYISYDNNYQPLIYRFELNGHFTDIEKYSICIYYFLSEEQNCTLNPIKKINIPISKEDGITLEINDLYPVDNFVNITSSDEILVHQTFIIKGVISLIINNEKEVKVVNI